MDLLRRIFAVGGVLVCVTTGMAQVRQVNQGQALDANYRIGSGGYNTTVDDLTLPNGQLIVSGQVTGLSAFHGRTGYFAPDQLNLRLPSNSQDTFNKQSVGIGDILAGQAYQSFPYSSPYATVLNPSQLAVGVSQGQVNYSSTDRYVEPAAARQLYLQATRQYKSLMEATSINVSQATPLIRTSPLMPKGLSVASQPAETWRNVPVESLLLRSGQTALFGAPTAEERQELAKELYELGQRMEGRPAEPQPGEPREPAKVPNIDQKLLRGDLPPANQDVFLDMMLAVRDQQARNAQAYENSLPGKTTPRELSVPPAQDTGRLVEVTGDTTLVLHSLAGLNNDMFNVYMNRAQEELKSGKYYAAVGSYGVALTIKPANPLGRVGQGLAQFCAGEPSNAAAQFYQAMALFPPLMETKLDLSAIAPKKAILRELEFLTQRLAQGPDANNARLHFLATYLFKITDNEPKAREYAQRLQALAGDDKLLKGYAELILTGKHPDSGEPDTQPAPTTGP